jgi:L-iditol 2-dehydrogenase
MTEQMAAARLHAVNDIRIEKIAKPHLDPDQVMVRVMAVGVCGSDVHYYNHGHIGSNFLDGPLVLGHELSGVIVEAGQNVDQSRIGQRVAVEPQAPCADCDKCLQGQYNLCRDQSKFAFEIPDSMSFEAGALIEPLSVGIWSCKKANVGPGTRVLIAGAGPIGMVSIMAAKAYGATDITITDLSQERLEIARRIGATRVIDVSSEAPERASFDCFIDASGAEKAIVNGVEALDKSGVAVLVGLGSETATLPISHIMDNEIIVTGVYRYANTWPSSIELVKAGVIDLDQLVTSRFPLEETEKALLASGKPGELKPVVLPNG